MKPNRQWILLLQLLLVACTVSQKPTSKSPGTLFDSNDNLESITNSFFVQTKAPYRMELCEADESSKSCLNKETGISAKGIGGMFLPLKMDMAGLEVEKSRMENGNLNILVSLDASINLIPPWCGKVGGHLQTVNETPKLVFSNFYCNWAGVGNVLTNMEFTVETLDSISHTFSGHYKIRFLGTGNGIGSGYYKTSITRKE